MSEEVMNLRALGEKTPDCALLRERIGLAAERRMELEVGTATDAAYGERESGRKAQRNGSCDRDWVDVGQKTVRGTVFPTIGSISLLASVARQGIGNAREGTGQPSSPSPNSLQQRTERLPGSSCSTCWKPCPIRSTPFSPTTAFSSPSSLGTATPFILGPCVST